VMGRTNLRGIMERNIMQRNAMECNKSHDHIRWKKRRMDAPP
jgi:hypothetical protein